MQHIPHIPVLANEVLSTFEEIEDGIIIDCTLGYGGHSELILSHNKNIKIIACDRDDEAIEFSKKRLEQFGNRIEIHKSNFSQILKKIDTKNIRGILADIGLSSLQIDKNDRGFGLNSDTLDMRMDKNQDLTAQIVINSYPKKKLEQIFKDYGEIQNYNFLVEKIIKARSEKAVKSAKELKEIIGNNFVKNRTIPQAILVFQAIRIEVNKELEELKNLLNDIKNSNINKAKVAIISFHSLEDRIVKNAFRTWSKNCICPDFAIKCECGNNHSIGKILSKKAIVPTKEEIKNNSRSSCSKMRIFYIDKR